MLVGSADSVNAVTDSADSMTAVTLTGSADSMTAVNVTLCYSSACSLTCRYWTMCSIQAC